MRLIAQNPKAHHDYQLLDKLEAGLVLSGGEVKSAKVGNVSIKEAHVRIINGEAFLLGAFIKPYGPAGQTTGDPTRTRKLLLHKRELSKLIGSAEAKQQTIIPLRLYEQKGLLKLEIALAKGKKLHDKRHDLKARQQQREAAAAMKRVSQRS